MSKDVEKAIKAREGKPMKGTVAPGKGRPGSYPKKPA